MTSILAVTLSALATLSPIKVHVDGDGYMRFIRDGRVVYAKQATLSNVNGDLGADGAKLLPEVPIPDSATSILIDLMGNIEAGTSHLGRLVLGTFPIGAASSLTGSFVTFSDSSTLTNPGEGTAGVIRVDATNTIAAQVSDPKPARLQVGKPQFSTFNLEIAGEGYFMLNGPNGTTCYTRNGAFTFSSLGQVETLNGFLLEPNITIPSGATAVSVSATGCITYTPAGETRPKILGSIILSRFASPAGLVKLDTDIFSEGPHSGTPIAGNPGQENLGLIKFGGTLHGDDSNIAAAHTAASKPITTNHVKTPVQAKTTGGAQVEIIVRQHTDTEDKNFSIGDIADVTGPDELVTAYKKVVIGTTAMAGTNRVIDQHYVILKLMGAGFHPGDYALVVPDGADVSRKSVTISAEDIIAAAVKAAQDKTGMKVDFKPTKTVDPVVADTGEFTIDASEAVLNNKHYFVVVTVRQGTTILTTRSIELTPPSDLRSIKAGDAITIVFKSGNAEIEVPGKAMSMGYLGQQIEFSITGAGSKPTTQIGTVIDTGKVEVDL